MCTPKSRTLLVLFTLALPGLASIACGQGEPRTYEAQLTNNPPTLDGVVSPGEWDKALAEPIASVLRASSTTTTTPNYEFRILWDLEAMYVLFKTNLGVWPGGQGGFGGNNNINFYFNPNTDGEENRSGGDSFDGYHIVAYPDTGKTSRFDTPFDPVFRNMFQEARLNANFGHSQTWTGRDSQEEGVAVNYVSEVGPRGGVMEMCFPWALFNAQEDLPEDEREIFHAFAPEIGSQWHVQIGIISAGPEQLPIWNWQPGQFFAEGPHGVVTFTGKIPPVPITELAHDPENGMVNLSWQSQDGKLYNLRSAVDPPTADPATWPIYQEQQDLVATPPVNTLSFPVGDDARRFFIIEEFPAPPVSIYLEDFENGLGEWTIGSDGEAGTAWDLGAPAAPGPTAANSGANCLGTNLAGTYEVNADVWLLSPPIDLTEAGGATLRFFQWTDIEEGFDEGIVRVLDAADDSEIAVLESIGGLSDWEEESVQLPAEALGKNVKFEFRFQSDELENFVGWYLDDINVTVP